MPINRINEEYFDNSIPQLDAATLAKFVSERATAACKGQHSHRFDPSKNAFFRVRPRSSSKKLLTIFPPLLRFSLDIVATQFYTFFNCNIRIAEIDATHRKGRIG